MTWRWGPERMSYRDCYCGWWTAHFSGSVTAARLRSHTRREHPGPVAEPVDAPTLFGDGR
jgi:hypothetical protein